ncbi:MAG: isoamylase early set domain-containing protein [Bacteroidetes bacterium]|nr:isoamylase early set domain-containing protein [Bacteroidota bacterium]
MAIRKKFLKSKPLCKVSFDFSANRIAGEAKKVEVLGDFNDWSPIPLRKVKGDFTRTVDLETGKEYQFRYRINGDLWENDEAADAYVNNGISGDNSVIRLN